MEAQEARRCIQPERHEGVLLSSPPQYWCCRDGCHNKWTVGTETPICSIQPEKEKLILPKSYISWSAFTVWKQNPERFKREYFGNGPRLDSKYLRFGKSIASAIENGTYKESLPRLEVYSEVEFQINAEVSGVPILSYIDSYDPIKNVFREYKTGMIRNPWSAAKVYKHGQLVFYAVALRAITGKMPEYCHLDWIITDDSCDESDFWSRVAKKLKVTGNIKPFKRVFDVRELDRMEAEIVQVAKEISEAYKEYLKNQL